MSDEQMTTNDNPVQEESNTVLGSGSDNQDWKSTLPEDLKNDATLQNFKNVEDLAKNLITAGLLPAEVLVIKSRNSSSPYTFNALSAAATFLS